jgi:MFS family permease
VIEPASAQPVIGTVSPGARDLAGGEDMTSLAAATSTHRGSDESAGTNGFAVGGEWAGSALLAAENGPAAARGRYGMFAQMGVGSGLVMGSRLFLIVNSSIGETGRAFMDWGSRQPFLFSAVLIGINLYVRLNVGETHISE